MKICTTTSLLPMILSATIISAVGVLYSTSAANAERLIIEDPAGLVRFSGEKTATAELQIEFMAPLAPAVAVRLAPEAGLGTSVECSVSAAAPNKCSASLADLSGRYTIQLTGNAAIKRVTVVGQ